MFAGHIGAALAIGRTDRDTNVGIFVAAALLLDILLWIFVLWGWETVVIPASFSSSHQAEFTFQYSHGLLASLGWSALGGLITWVGLAGRPGRRRAALLVALAVFSHWALDVIVHRPELPLAGSGSHLMGLGLWNNVALALTIEIALLAIGLGLFISRSPLTSSKSTLLFVVAMIIGAFTVVGMTIGPVPPSARTMAASSLGTLAVVCILFYWMGRVRRLRSH
jgi:hypothetical protein